MQVALIILFFIIFIEVLLIGFLFSNVILSIEKINANSINRKITEVHLEKINIKLQIYIFKYFKVFNVKFYKNYFEILNIRINYEKIFKKYNITDKIDTYSKIYKLYKLIKENPSKISVKKIKPKFNSLKLNLSISTENSIITSFATCFLSTIISILLKNNLNSRKYNLDKFEYKITPIYLNFDSFKLDLESNISFSMFDILEFVYEYKKLIKEENFINKQKSKELVQQILKRSIYGFKILNKVRYINKRVTISNNKFL